MYNAATVDAKKKNKNKPQAHQCKPEIVKLKLRFCCISVCVNVTRDVAVNRKQIKSSARIRYLAASSN